MFCENNQLFIATPERIAVTKFLASALSLLWAIVKSCLTWLHVKHMTQTICLHCLGHPVSTLVYLQLYLKLTVHASFSRSLFRVFFGRFLPLCPLGVYCSACLAMHSVFLLNMCPNQTSFTFFFAYLF